MPRYSVATTRNNLSQLIDKAVAGGGSDHHAPRKTNG
jgi:hypothetical protein